MSEKVVRIRIENKIFNRFKALCALKELSIPKQTEALIAQFVKIHEHNENILKSLGEK